MTDPDLAPDRAPQLDADRAPRLSAVPDLPATGDRFRLLVASLDLGYALVRIVRAEDGTPVDYVVVEHNDAMERQLGTSGAGELASVLTPGFDPDWALGFGRVAETGVSERVERFDPAVDRWIDALAVRVGEPSDPLVAVVFRDTTAAHRNADLLHAGRERHAFLLRLSDALRPLDDPVAVQAAATRLLNEHLGAERTFYAVVDPGGARIAIRADHHVPGAPDAPSLVPSAVFGLQAGSDMAAGRTVVVEDLGLDPRTRGLLSLDGRPSDGAALGVPLVKDGRWVAVLAVRCTGPRAWTPDEIELVEETAERTWASVERAVSAAALADARRHLDAERERTLAHERAARRQAEAATRMRDAFLANVSHELRTPLAAILLWSRLLASGRAPGRELEALDIIERNAEAQRLLVDDLLDASRAMAGTLSITPRRQALGPIAQAAADTMLPLAEAKGVDVRVRTVDVHAVVDAGRLGQVVRNLLDNAIRHTPAGGTIRIEIARRGRHAELAVIDTGGGIEAELLPHIFERFRRGAPTGEDHGGLGLGLSISRELVVLHGGTLTVRSDGPGTGATFTVRLPIEPATPPATPRRVRVRRDP